MKLFLVIFLFIFTLGICSVSAESIYSLIQNGNLDEARDSLSHRSSAVNRNGNDLYFLSLLEESADKSAQLMEAAMRASVSPIYLQDIYYRLAHYYLLKEDFRMLQSTVNDYLVKWENGRYRSEMFRFKVYFEENKKNYNSAIKEIDRYLLEYPKGDDNQFGMIDKARIMNRFEKPVAANKLLKELSREKKGPGVPLALYALAENAIRDKRTDDAVFYYNINRDGFPHSVGLDATIDKLSDMSTAGDRDNKAEKYTGTFYSVQVGVFSTNENAQRFSQSFKTYNKQIDIKTKTISDKKYYVVFVGKFTTYNSAFTFKETLESKHNEAFQVIAR